MFDYIPESSGKKREEVLRGSSDEKGKTTVLEGSTEKGAHHSNLVMWWEKKETKNDPS